MRYVDIGIGLIQLLTAAVSSGSGGQNQPAPGGDTGGVTTTAAAAAMSTAAPVAGSSFAAVNWDTAVVIFYQDRSANIRMVECNVTTSPENLTATTTTTYQWSRPALLPFTARNATPIAAIGWLGTRDRREV